MMAEPVATNGYEELTPSSQSSFLELLYGTLFQPIRTFKALNVEPQTESRPLFQALLSVLLISGIAPVIHLATVGGAPSTLVFGIPLSTLAGVITWVFTGLVVALLAYTFTGQTRIRTFLILSGLATLPWLLMGPISLLKVGLGVPGLVLCALLGLIVWLWTVLLFILALAVTYGLTPERVMIVLAMPFAMLVVLLGWIFGFFNNISHLVPPA